MPLILGTNSIKDTGYDVDNSLRFNDGSSDSLQRTPSGVGNGNTWTFSVWVKKSNLSITQFLIGSSTSASDFEDIRFNANTGELSYNRYLTTKQWGFDSNTYLRDVSGWYHVVVNRNGTTMNYYLNGVLQTKTNEVTSTSTGDFNTTDELRIGGRPDTTSNTFDGYMSHVSWVDGQALAPTVFGETDSTSGIWKFKQPSGVTWGTNGFHLKFENSGALGTDSSGNTNTFTVNGNGRQALDTPSNVYATLNPLHFGTGSTSNTTLTNGNNTFTSTQGGSPYPYYFSTLGNTEGKYYAEFKYSAGVSGDAATVGIGSVPDSYSGNNSLSWSYYANGNVYNGGSSSSYGNAWNVGSILGVAMDLDNSKLYFSINGTWQNSGVPTSGSTGTGAKSITANTLYLFEVGDAGGNQPTIQCNFGNGYFGTTAITSAGSNGNGSLFEYDVPSGYYALNTKNINTYG